MKEQEKYIVMVYPKRNSMGAEELKSIRDWDGQGPLYYNGRYYGSFSGDIAKAKLYTKLKDAEDRLTRILYDYEYTRKERVPFKLIRIAKVTFTPQFVGDDIVKDFQSELNEIWRLRDERWNGQG